MIRLINFHSKFKFLILITLFSFQFCKNSEEYKPVEITKAQLSAMLVSRDVEKIVVVNNIVGEIYIKANKINNPEYLKLLNNGSSKLVTGRPQFSITIESIEKFEEELMEIEKGFPENEIIAPEYIFKKDLITEILVYLIPLSFVSIIIISFIIWLLLLIHILKSDFNQPIDKLTWVFVTTFIPIIGLFLYWFIGKKQRKPDNNMESDRPNTASSQI